jgi:transmembrane sensor
MGSSIEDQADEWWSLLRTPDGEKHRAEFEKWRASDVRHAKAFSDAEANWNMLAGLKRPAPLISSSPPKVRAYRPAFALAGIVGILIIGAVIFARAPNPEETGKERQVTVQSGSALRAFRLSDGSVVLLDVHSKVSVDLSGAERKIALDAGRARFIVAHDPLHPFIVNAAGETVTARGTVFDVGLSSKGSRIVLIRGVIEVTSAPSGNASKEPLVMIAGQTVSVSNTSAHVVPTLEADQNWPSSNLRFESIPLQRLIGLANRHGQTTIRLADGVSGDRTITGTFDIRASDALSAQLAAALGLKVTRDVGGIVLSN